METDTVNPRASRASGASALANDGLADATLRFSCLLTALVSPAMPPRTRRVRPTLPRRESISSPSTLRHRSGGRADEGPSGLVISRSKWTASRGRSCRPSSSRSIARALTRGRPVDALVASNVSPQNARAAHRRGGRPDADHARELTPLLRTAAEFVDRLTPADYAAFIGFPEPGPSLDFTTDKTLVKRRCRRSALAGRQEPCRTTSTSPCRKRS